jgi:hypothetical protein
MQGQTRWLSLGGMPVSCQTGLYVVRYIDFLKKNVGYIPSVKYGHTP